MHDVCMTAKHTTASVTRKCMRDTRSNLMQKKRKLDDTCLMTKRTMQNVAVANKEDFVQMKWQVADEELTWDKLMMMVPAVRNALMIGRDRKWVTKPRRRKPRIR